MDKVKTPIIPLLGTFILGAFYYISRLGDLRDRLELFFVIFAGIFLLYLVAALLVIREKKRKKWLLVAVIAFAVLFRCVLLPSNPVLSSDIYRYLWEGKVLLAGDNPFKTTPQDHSLEFLRDENYEGINHKHLETIYPPLAQGAFALGAKVKANLTTQKIIFSLFDIAVVLILILLLAAKGIDPARSIIYAWNPLVILEFAHSGHLDSLGIFFLMLGVLFLHNARRAYGFAALAFSFLSKYFSAVLMPFFAMKRKYVHWLVLYVLIIAAGYLPFASASTKLFGTLQVYASQWEFNSVVFTLLRSMGFDPVWIRRLLLAFLVVFSIYQGHRNSDFLKYCYFVIGCALLLSPTVFPWYVCWIVPFLCFFPNPAWLLFTGLVVASYWVLPLYKQTNFWVLDEKVLLLEYLPFYFLLLYRIPGAPGPAKESSGRGR